MSFTHYSAFTVQAGQVPSAQTNFPVLLKPTDNRFKTVANGGHVANSSGFDLRPYADAGGVTPLSFDLVTDTYDGSTGTFEMWVKISSLDVGSVIYLFYGDPGLSSDGSNKASTWSNSYTLVTHLGNGTTLDVNDSSGNGNNGTNANVTATTGQIDGAGNFNGTTAKVTGSMTASVPPFTLSFWVQFTPTLVAPECPFQFNSGAGNNGIRARISTNGKAGLTFGGVADYEFDGTPDIHDDGTWYFWAFTVDNNNGTGTSYVGEDSGNTFTSDTVAVGTVSGTPADYTIGTDVFNNFVKGIMDEVHFATVARSSDWLETEFNNQLDPASFYSIGTEQQVDATRAGSLLIMFQ